jgi:hypothetical protein
MYDHASLTTLCLLHVFAMCDGHQQRVRNSTTPTSNKPLLAAYKHFTFSLFICLLGYLGVCQETMTPEILVSLTVNPLHQYSDMVTHHSANSKQPIL